MKVQEFIKQVEGGKLDLKNIIKTFYLPVSKKREIAALVLELSMINNEGFVHVDEFKKILNLRRVLIQEYFDLEFESFLEEYDMLERLNVLDYIFEDYLGSEYKRAVLILEQETKNMLAEHSIEAELVKLIRQVRIKVESLSETFDSQFKDFDITTILPEGMKVEDFMQMVERLK